jgi:hypothetical protein
VQLGVGGVEKVMLDEDGEGHGDKMERCETGFKYKL